MIPTPITDPDDPNDAWALTGPGYALDKFYFRASDQRGHSHTCQVKVTPNLAAQINVLVGDPNLPYKSMTEVFRDAITHRVHWILEEQRRVAGDPDAALWKAQLDVLFMEKMALLNAEIENQRAVFEQAWTTLQTLVAEGFIDKAYEHVDEFEDVVLNYTDRDWRRKYMAEVDQMRDYITTPQANRGHGIRVAR